MIRVVLADDHEVIRAGFKLILEQDPNIAVVGEAAEGKQAYAMVSKEHPDLLLLDISMPPGQSGLIACQEISQDFPKVRIIILSMYAEPEYLYYTLKGGAKGYLVKTVSAETFLEAVHAVAEGGVFVAPDLLETLSGLSGDDLRDLEKLSPRELEVLQLLARGFTNREIAEQAYLSVKTAEAHRAKIYSKLGFKTRADLVAFALRHKLLDA
ncbi:MAG: response regulator transcription factor [Coriobacteriia bacterium]|nr:response regulator transcription factor [Coriobacteriia bacterium]